MKKLVLIFFGFTYGISGAQITEEPIMLRAENCDIQGLLMLPNEQATTVVLIVSSTGNVDRDGNLPMMKNYAYMKYAYAMAANNIATVRYDKRGVGTSVLLSDEENLRFSDYINDVKGWVDLLSRDKRFNKIIIAGHGEGALLAMAAMSQGCKAKGLISIAGMGQTFDEILKEQFASEHEQVRKIAYDIIDQLKTGKTVDDVPVFLGSLFHKQMQPYIISSFMYDPHALIGKVKVPILIIQGSTDLQVKVDNAQLLSEGNPKAKVVIINGMNHMLKDCHTLDPVVQRDTYVNPAYALSPRLVVETVKFIESVN